MEHVIVLTVAHVWNVLWIESISHLLLIHGEWHSLLLYICTSIVLVVGFELIGGAIGTTCIGAAAHGWQMLLLLLMSHVIVILLLLFHELFGIVVFLWWCGAAVCVGVGGGCGGCR